MNKKYYSTVEEFNKAEQSSEMVKSAFKELKPTKTNMIGFILSVVISLFGAVFIGWAEETVRLLVETADTLLSIQLALFGCIFAVYSIIVAFLSDDMMKRLSSIQTSEQDASSMLKKYTAYFESVLILYFIGICITEFVCLLCKWIPPNFRLTNSLICDNALVSLLVSVYLAFSFRLIYEIKSTIYNTVMLFRYSIAFKFVGFSKDVESKNEETK